MSVDHPGGSAIPVTILTGFLGAGKTTLLNRILNGKNHAAHHRFSRWTYEAETPLSVDRLREAAKKLPCTVYRAKGLIYTADDPDRRGVLQLVGRRVDVTLEDLWGQRPRRTQIVAIGVPDGMDEDDLRRRFDARAADVPANRSDGRPSTPTASVRHSGSSENRSETR